MSHTDAPDEVRALSRLAFSELQAAAGGVGSMHLNIAGRAFRATGAAGRPVQVAHDAIAGGVYRSLQGAAGALGHAADVALRRRPREPHAVSTHPRGTAVLAVVNGLIGDVLEREESPLHQPMSVRVGGRAVDLERAALAAAFPAASRHVVVFVHGLMESEQAWNYRAWETGHTYATRLARDIGCTPVHVRYNTGRRISRNGVALAELLDQLVANWPVEVAEVSLVGHSMGGLVARSACHHAKEDGRAWIERVRHIVSLGTPHLGAPLEQAVHLTSAALSALPETQVFGSFLRRRSGGIRDLHQGSLVDEDWEGRDHDALRAAACKEVPLLDGVTHCFVSATVTRNPKHPVGRIIGDWLVLRGSASGRGRTRSIPFEEEHGLHVGGAHHIALLNHPAVYGRLRHWLSAGDPPPARVERPARPSRRRIPGRRAGRSPRAAGG